MKQTAVEWLQQRHVEVNWLRWSDEISLKYADELREDYFNQAKEIEKEQIIDAYADGRISVVSSKIISYEQYYNETFKNKL